jgi:hypothetical protein
VNWAIWRNTDSFEDYWYLKPVFYAMQHKLRIQIILLNARFAASAESTNIANISANL